ncbi:MAG: patatin-like phospholipase RssA [Pseudomonadota bacterium]
MNIGLALGSGSSRGWSHIGIIKALIDMGIEPDVVCGTSIGALVGASYVSNNLDKLEGWVCSLTKFKLVKYFEIKTSLNGFIDKKKLQEFLNEYVSENGSLIEDLSKKYASVATEIATGREVWITNGSVLDAVWASISLPGLFPAINKDDQWLVDGGLVNPVPISVCRALGADVVIAVNLNSDIVGKHFNKTKRPAKNKEADVFSKISGFVKKYSDWEFRSTVDEDKDEEVDNAPNLIDAIANSINIAQDRITRSRIAGDPPDILLTPKLSHIGLLDFHRAKEAIAEGRQCVERVKAEINYLLKNT